ncbi:MAG: CHASE2 domain-containing protein [Candidatus Accumulibacter meliphilus]|uniref:CHASE2 domain-containing protein n=1 Tax=Candidatus Accumulibacter meliphilus TaxID=2211374 RepID=A0A369XJK8_9PROT|nr:MAG: CHASE2 domain-containing protein [Candidatus Accumulibacter meliphilus]
MFAGVACDRQLKTGRSTVRNSPSRLFISYRREDSIAYAGRLYDHLSAHFGAEQVFMDIGQIEAGDDFVNVLDHEIDACDVVIALIGPRWLSASNENGRRLDQPDDFVCHELAAALAQGKRLIPVLVGGATMPEASELPATLAELSRRQAHALDDKRFKFELDALIRSIEQRPSLLDQFVQVMNAERLRKWQRYSGAGIALLMFFLGWVKLFDALGIDTRIEGYTMALGDMVASVPVSEHIVIVSFNEKSEARLGSFGPDWRREHARVLDRLVDAGAKMIVFDLYFEEPNPADAELIAAIERARQRGREVIVGVKQLRDQEPLATPGLLQAASDWGLLCVGGRLGYASVAPIGAVKLTAAVDAKQQPVDRIRDRIAAIGGLAVGGRELGVDKQLRELTLLSDTNLPLWSGSLEAFQASIEDSGKVSKGCPLLGSGDLIADTRLRLAPIEIWRQPPRRYDYEQISGPAATIAADGLAGKIVLIGDGRTGEDHFQVRRGIGAEFRHGVELHADVVNNLLQEVHVRGLDPLLQVLAMAALAVAGAWLRLFRPAMPALWRRLLLLGCLLFYLALTVLIYVQFEVLLNTAYHIGAFLLSYWLLGKLSASAAAKAA